MHSIYSRPRKKISWSRRRHFIFSYLYKNTHLLSPLRSPSISTCIHFLVFDFAACAFVPIIWWNNKPLPPHPRTEPRVLLLPGNRKKKNTAPPCWKVLSWSWFWSKFWISDRLTDEQMLLSSEHIHECWHHVARSLQKEGMLMLTFWQHNADEWFCSCDLVMFLNSPFYTEASEGSQSIIFDLTSLLVLVVCFLLSGLVVGLGSVGILNSLPWAQVQWL